MKGLNILLALAVLALTHIPNNPTHSAVVKRWAAISSLSDNEDDNGDLTKRWLEPSSYGGAEPSYIKRAIGQEQESQFPEFPVNDVGEFEGEVVPNEDLDKSIAPSSESPVPKEEEAKFEDVKDNEIDVEEKVPIAKEPKKVYYNNEDDEVTTTHKPWHKKAWHYLRDKIFKFGRDERGTIDYDLDDY